MGESDRKAAGAAGGTSHLDPFQELLSRPLRLTAGRAVPTTVVQEVVVEPKPEPEPKRNRTERD